MPVRQIVSDHIRDSVSISSGTRYHHGYRFDSKDQLESHFDFPLWVSPNRKYAGDYGYTLDKPVKRLWEVEATAELPVVYVECYNILRKMNDGGLLHEPPIKFQTFQLPGIVAEIVGRELAGIIDLGGTEILITSPRKHLTIVSECELPDTKDEWNALNGTPF